MRRNKFENSRSFIDYLFNLLLGFVVLLFLAMMLINPVAKKDILDPKAEYLIILTWDDNSLVDYDLWVRDNKDNTVNFRDKDKELITLDRDDLGQENDKFTNVYGNTEIKFINREIISIRTTDPRTYLVNVHMFNGRGMRNIEDDVTVELFKVNPFIEAKRKTVKFDTAGQMKHYFEFTVNEDETIDIKETDEVINIVSQAGYPGG